jgi:hypothetical protein
MIIAFEPDARVCPRCERIYHRDHVPDTCACGGAMSSAHGKSGPDSADADAKSERTSDSAPQASHA